MNLPTFITYLPQSLSCGNSGALPTGPGLWAGGKVALQRSRRLDNCRCASHTCFEVLLYARRAGIHSNSGQGAGRRGRVMCLWPFHFTPREHSGNEHKDSCSLLPVAILQVFPCLWQGNAWCLSYSCSFPPARTWEASSAEQLSLASGTWQWHWSGVPCPISLPRSQQSRRKGGKVGFVFRSCKSGDSSRVCLVQVPMWRLRQRAVLLSD